eukprot:9007-Amphidinium_carterae.2
MSDTAIGQQSPKRSDKTASSSEQPELWSGFQPRLHSDQLDASNSLLPLSAMPPRTGGSKSYAHSVRAPPVTNASAPIRRQCNCQLAVCND